MRRSGNGGNNAWIIFFHSFFFGLYFLPFKTLCLYIAFDLTDSNGVFNL